MTDKNEKIILLIIKYTPPFFIIFLSIVVSFILFENNKKVFDKEKVITKKQFIKNNKDYVKSEVFRVNQYIKTTQEKTEKKLKDNIKGRVEEAYSIAMNIYNENKHLGKKAVTKMIKDALRNIRFNNNRGYFFIYSFDYECILLPIDSKLEGSNFYNFKDSKGDYLTRRIVENMKKDKEGFLTWWFHKPNDMKKHYKKLGFNKTFEPYNWFIGTGEYIEDFENDLKIEVLDHIRNHKFLKNDYFFILDYEGNYISHIRENYIGSNALNVANITKDTIARIIDTTKNNSSGFVTYTQNDKPGSHKAVTKTSYVAGIDKWRWIIGKGFYEDDVNKIIKEEESFINERLRDNLKKLIIFTLILTILLLLISFYMSTFLEKMFKRYRLQIEENLKELTKQHNILAQQSKLAAIGTMIGNIAHQWRQPLSLISTIATGTKLKKELNTLEEKELFDNLDNINNTTQYLSKTIDDFRNFFNSNKIKKEFSVKEAFKNCFNLINVQFKNHNIEIIQNTQNSQIYAIQTELVQVLINILNNSRDELIKLENQRKLIFIDTEERDNQVIISIKDNAGGVDTKILDHIFEPYFTTKHQSQGTGIGLYMSQEIIVKHMRGSINMENVEFIYEGVKYKGALTTIKLKLHK